MTNSIDLQPSSGLTSNNRLKVLLVAGEPSGDALGGQLMVALKQLFDGEITFSGVGGPIMARQGLNSLFDFDQIALIGVSQVLRTIPNNLKRIRQIADHALETIPDAIVLIDSGEFNQWLAQRLKNKNFRNPIIKFVSPQIWGSRPNRIFKLARAYDHVMTLLPFEPAYYEKASLPATYIGHPVTERNPVAGSGRTFRRQNDIPEDETLICVLPGSRRGEIKYMLPLFRQTLDVLADRQVSFSVVIPTVPNVHDKVAEAIKEWPWRTSIVTGEEERFAAFDASTVALATSGTVALELAIARVPMIVGYKIGRLGAMIYRHLILVRFITLANLILGREVVPEFLQEYCQPELMADALEKLLQDRKARATQIALLETVVDELTVEGEKPSIRAAKTVLEIVGIS